MRHPGRRCEVTSKSDFFGPTNTFLEGLCSERNLVALLTNAEKAASSPTRPRPIAQAPTLHNSPQCRDADFRNDLIADKPGILGVWGRASLSANIPEKMKRAIRSPVFRRCGNAITRYRRFGNIAPWPLFNTQFPAKPLDHQTTVGTVDCSTSFSARAIEYATNTPSIHIHRRPARRQNRALTKRASTLSNTVAAKSFSKEKRQILQVIKIVLPVFAGHSYNPCRGQLNLSKALTRAHGQALAITRHCFLKRCDKLRLFVAGTYQAHFTPQHIPRNWATRHCASPQKPTDRRTRRVALRLPADADGPRILLLSESGIRPGGMGAVASNRTCE